MPNIKKSGYIVKADKLESHSNKVITIDDKSTDEEYPSAKAVYLLCVMKDDLTSQKILKGTTETIITDGNKENNRVILINDPRYTGSEGDIIFAGYKAEYDYNNDGIIDNADLAHLKAVISKEEEMVHGKIYDIDNSGSEFPDASDPRAFKVYVDEKTGFYIWDGSKWEKYEPIVSTSYDSKSFNPQSGLAVAGIVAILEQQISSLTEKLNQLEKEIEELKK